jgi:hypothetical protein
MPWTREEACWDTHYPLLRCARCDQVYWFIDLGFAIAGRLGVPCHAFLGPRRDMSMSDWSLAILDILARDERNCNDDDLMTMWA